MPPAVALKLPPLVRVSAEPGNVIAALLNTMVKLRKLVNEVKLVGNTAAELILRNAMSRKLPKVPANVIAVEPKLFACVFNNISELALLAVIDVAAVPPVAVIAPVCEILPPETNVKLRPIVEVPNTKPMEFVIDTSLVPLLERDTAPVKLLLVPLMVKLIPFAPALKLDVPGTVNAPV